MTRGDEQYVQQRGEVPRVARTVGVFVDRTVDGLARVNTQGSLVSVKCDGWAPPVPGMSVRLESTNGIMRLVGPAGPRSASGVVIASLSGDTRASVLVDGVEWDLPVMAPYVPIPTDEVVVDWMSGAVLGELAASAGSDAPAPNPGGGGGAFSGLLVQATDSGRYNTGGSAWGDSTVWTGTSTRGLWVYSGGFAALAGANVTSAEIYLPLIQQQNNMSFGLHTQPSKPGSDPGFSNVTAHDGPRSGWVGLPAGWGNILRDNPSWGVGVLSPGGGLNQWVGRGADGMSGAIRFAGTR